MKEEEQINLPCRRNPNNLCIDPTIKEGEVTSCYLNVGSTHSDFLPKSTVWKSVGREYLYSGDTTQTLPWPGHQGIFNSKSWYSVYT